MLVTWQYRERRSLIQWFDPRAWLIYYACHLGTTLLFWDARYLFVLFVLAMIWVFTSGIRWREMRRAWLFIGGFVIFFTFLTFLTGRGGTEVYETETLIRRLEAPFTIFGWQPALNVTLEKTFFALSQMMRVSSLAALTIMIPYSLDPSKYGITFRGLGLPDKIAYAMDLTMRFIPSFGRDFQLTLDAQKARGYELEKLQGGLFAQVRKLAPLMVPVTIHSIIASEDIIDAMDLRAFGTQQRTWLEQLKYKNRDYILIAFGVILLFVSMVLSLFGFGQFWIPVILLRQFGG